MPSETHAASGGTGDRAARKSLLKALRALSRPGGERLAPIPDGALAEALSRGLIETRSGRAVLTRAGAQWLRRELSGAEDPFREQHQERSLKTDPSCGGEERVLLVDETESPLAWLRRRKDKAGGAMISDAQFAAGERLRADFTFAQMTPRTTMSWGAGIPASGRRGPAGAGVELRDNVIGAKQRVARALRAVGPELSGVLLDVCCHLKGLEAAEDERGWPQRSGKVVLQLALTRLARHYGLLAAEEPIAREAGAILHWGADGYRPDAGGWT